VKDWRKGEFVEYVRNADYFVKGRPYLDGLRYLIIPERGTATAALQAGRVDVAFPGETPKPIADGVFRSGSLATNGRIGGRVRGARAPSSGRSTGSRQSTAPTTTS